MLQLKLQRWNKIIKIQRYFVFLAIGWDFFLSSKRGNFFSREETANFSFSGLQKQSFGLSHEVGTGDANAVRLQTCCPACGWWFRSQRCGLLWQARGIHLYGQCQGEGETSAGGTGCKSLDYFLFLSRCLTFLGCIPCFYTQIRLPECLLNNW